jgi:hypothetical protein
MPSWAPTTAVGLAPSLSGTRCLYLSYLTGICLWNTGGASGGDGERVFVPAYAVATVIGKKGASIQFLEKESGAKVQVGASGPRVPLVRTVWRLRCSSRRALMSADDERDLGG